jgi:hypothetical protein
VITDVRIEASSERVILCYKNSETKTIGRWNGSLGNFGVRHGVKTDVSFAKVTILMKEIYIKRIGR